MQTSGIVDTLLFEASGMAGVGYEQHRQFIRVAVHDHVGVERRSHIVARYEDGNGGKPLPRPVSAAFERKAQHARHVVAKRTAQEARQLCLA